MTVVYYVHRMVDLDKPNNPCHFSSEKDLRLAIKYMKEIGKVIPKQCFIHTYISVLYIDTHNITNDNITRVWLISKKISFLEKVK